MADARWIYSEKSISVNVHIVFQLNYKCIYRLLYVVLGIEPKALCITRQAFCLANVCIF